MLKKTLFGILVTVQCFAASDTKNTQTKPEKTDQEQPIDIDAVSETLGNVLGKTLTDPDNGFELNIEKIIIGLRNGSTGKPAPLPEQEYQQALIKLRQKAFDKQANENLQAAEEFLKKNKLESQVKELIPGKLQYKILQEGNGPMVKEDATPKIHYTGKLIDGKIFGTSTQTGPISIPLSDVVQGFRQGIAGMRKGEKRRLFIHPELAYGKQGELPPNVLLIFDVEVVETDTKQGETNNPSQEDEDLLEIDE